ncbi:hypothetical protein HELRODRAFT_177940 [Helobdella robusta]|uniref:IPT/TIG domain-containing protein n=1 Tax=Helobdella robusta TaxID=6412 RepID=T1FCI0_HELRO|nr:hypothetical protein HELRODRAFT_177940 [Helobdella robusta]ESN97511.1 hypothetical protein HELRODRAFT_177940 [Helobdella robusta]
MTVAVVVVVVVVAVGMGVYCAQPTGIPEISKKSLTQCSVKGGEEMFIIGKNFLKGTTFLKSRPAKVKRLKVNYTLQKFRRLNEYVLNNASHTKHVIGGIFLSYSNPVTAKQHQATLTIRPSRRM